MCYHLFTLHLCEENIFFLLLWGFSYFLSEMIDILQKEKKRENQNKKIFHVDWNIMLKLT